MLEKKILLASKSPRRKFLLEASGFEVEVLTIDVDESFDASMDPSDVPVFLANKKADAVSKQSYTRLPLITADTVVIYDNKILGKPKDSGQAIEFLKLMSGTEHTVVTGVAIRYKDRAISFGVSSNVKFDVFDHEELQYYIENYQPYDKAGAYGIQDWIGWCKISKLGGSYSNIMGLPTREVYQELRKIFDSNI